MEQRNATRASARLKGRASVPAMALGLILALAPAGGAFAADPAPAPAPKPVTTANPSIDLGDLKLLLEPLTKAELEVESSGWFDLLRAKVREVSEAELAVRRKNREIAALAKVEAAAKDVAAASDAVKDKAAGGAPQSEQEKAAAAKKLEEANASLAKSVEETKKDDVGAAAPAAAPAAAAAPGAPAAAAPPAPATDDQAIMNKAVESAQKKAEKTGDSSAVTDKVVAASKEANALDEVKDLAEKAPAAAGAAVAAAKTEAASPEAAAPTAAAKETSDKAGTLVEKAKEAAAAKSDVKVQLVDYSTELGSERTALTDRLKMVLDELELKGGKADDIRQYIAAVGGLKIDASDTTATIARLKSWVVADEGGLRWARNIGIFLAYVLISVLLSWVVRGLVDRGMRAAKVSSELLQNFIVGMSGKVVVFAGILAGLSALEINLAPLLAVIGAAGFVVAFALQGTLSNLASGLLIMVNEPFDVGDMVEVAGGIKGRIKEVTMFQTVVLTEDGLTKIVPNNSIWGGVIVNETMGTVTNADGTVEKEAEADGKPAAA